MCARGISLLHLLLSPETYPLTALWLFTPEVGSNPDIRRTQRDMTLSGGAT